MCDEANVTGVIKSFEEPVDLKGAVKTQSKCIYLMTLLCTFVQGSTQFQCLNWNHQLFLISSTMPLETSPICVHPVSETSACEPYHNICVHPPFFLVSLVLFHQKLQSS